MLTISVHMPRHGYGSLIEQVPGLDRRTLNLVHATPISPFGPRLASCESRSPLRRAGPSIATASHDTRVLGFSARRHLFPAPGAGFENVIE